MESKICIFEDFGEKVTQKNFIYNFYFEMKKPKKNLKLYPTVAGIFLIPILVMAAQPSPQLLPLTQPNVFLHCLHTDLCVVFVCALHTPRHKPKHKTARESAKQSAAAIW